MGNKSNTRVCRYTRCKHNGKINLDNDPYVQEGKTYYHKDCYEEKKDLQLIRSIWAEKINPTVVYSELNRVLNNLLKLKGVTSEYLLFVLNYVVDNNFNLNYPAGLKYYVDNSEIKSKYQQKKLKPVRDFDFVATDNEDSSPTFSINKSKPTGFSKILGG